MNLDTMPCGRRRRGEERGEGGGGRERR